MQKYGGTWQLVSTLLGLLEGLRRQIFLLFLLLWLDYLPHYTTILLLMYTKPLLTRVVSSHDVERRKLLSE